MALSRMKSKPAVGDVPRRPTPRELPEFIEYACNQFMATFSLKINIETQVKITLNEKKKSQSHLASKSLLSETTLPQPESSESDVAPEYITDGVTVVIVLVKDAHDHYVEIMFNRSAEIPCLLLQVLRMCLPYHPYMQRITVRWGPLNGESLYEISNFLSISHLSELMLDDSPVAARNYEVLLQQPSHLRVLSLARCDIDDEDCVNIVSYLEHPQPAAKTLCMLNFNSNFIGDVGARAIGTMLRTNRVLQYLNLAGNQITDSGAISILDSLAEFELTKNDLASKKARYLEYLRLRSEVYDKFVKELKEEKKLEETTHSRRKTLNRLQKKSFLTSEGMSVRAHAMTVERVGLFDDPFSSYKIIIRNDKWFCLGNLTLCSLNLSYNNLGFSSLSKIYNVLIHQSWHSSSSATGLLRLGIEGNYLPNHCHELPIINEMLERAQTSLSKANIARRPSQKKRQSK